MGFLKNLWGIITATVPPVHKGGQQIILIAAVVAFVLGLVDESGILDFIGVVFVIYCIYFFRDPARCVPQGEGLIVSPADGVVQLIERVAPPPELGMEEKELTRISIFLNIFNVHVQRVPISGTIEDVNYRPGKFMSANLDKASEENERQVVAIKTESGETVIVVQIAGLVARRILCYLEETQKVETGERYGLIRFGSRVDVYLPEGVHPKVSVGQLAIGGETILADFKSKSERKGKVI